MSFNKFSTSQAAQANDNPNGKTKTAAASGESEVKPPKKQDEAAPAQKS